MFWLFVGEITKIIEREWGHEREKGWGSEHHVLPLLFFPSFLYSHAGEHVAPHAPHDVMTFLAFTRIV